MTTTVLSTPPKTCVLVFVCVTDPMYTCSLLQDVNHGLIKTSKESPKFTPLIGKRLYVLFSYKSDNFDELLTPNRTPTKRGGRVNAFRIVFAECVVILTYTETAIKSRFPVHETGTHY